LGGKKKEGFPRKGGKGASRRQRKKQERGDAIGVPLGSQKKKKILNGNEGDGSGNAGGKPWWIREGKNLARAKIRPHGRNPKQKSRRLAERGAGIGTGKRVWPHVSPRTQKNVAKGSAKKKKDEGVLITRMGEEITDAKMPRPALKKAKVQRIKQNPTPSPKGPQQKKSIKKVEKKKKEREKMSALPSTEFLYGTGTG